MLRGRRCYFEGAFVEGSFVKGTLVSFVAEGVLCVEIRCGGDALLKGCLGRGHAF